MYKTVLPVLSVQTVLLVLVKLESVWINWSISESTFWSEFPVVWSRFDYTFWPEFPDLPFTGGALHSSLFIQQEIWVSGIIIYRRCPSRFTLHSFSSKRSEFLELPFTGGSFLGPRFTDGASLGPRFTDGPLWSPGTDGTFLVLLVLLSTFTL